MQVLARELWIEEAFVDVQGIHVGESNNSHTDGHTCTYSILRTVQHVVQLAAVGSSWQRLAAAVASAFRLYLTHDTLWTG